MSEQRADTVVEQPEPEEAPAPPRRHVSPRQWVRENLFNTWYNALLTLIFAPFAVWVLYLAFRFVFITGRWEVVQVNLTNFLVGRFPRVELWRPWVGAGVLAASIGLGLGVTARSTREAAEAKGVRVDTSWTMGLRRVAPLVLLIAVFVIFVRTATPLLALAGAVVVGAAGYVLGRRIPPALRRWVNLAVLAGLVAAYGVVAWFDGVPLAAWGGVLLTMFFAIGGIALSFPLGVALALGRRSTLPAVRVVCTTYIELIRGSPLIALLFMGWLVLPFFLPVGFPIPARPWRALVIFVLFTAAYVAEIVRGGLQSVPQGQYEAGQALGLRPWRVTRLVVLPQALRNVIPATVGQFISLYKDTSLVLVIGLLDLLAVGRAVTQQPDFLGRGLHAEALVFVSFIYWVGSYWMSRESQRLEHRLGVGQR